MSLKNLRAGLAGATIMTVVALAAPANAAQRYILTDLGIIPGAGYSLARAISQNGVIVGESGTDGVDGTGVRFDGGITVLPGLPGGNNTVIRGVNNAGVAAATIQTVDGDDRAALLTTSSAIQLDGLPGFAAAGAYGINNNGVVTGYVLESGSPFTAGGSLPIVPNSYGAQQAVTWTDGVATALSNDGVVNSVGFAINDAGTVAGIARLANNSPRAVSWDSSGALTILPLDGFESSRARAINSLGDIAGQVISQTPGFFSLYGAVWSGGSLTVLPGRAGFDSYTRGINSAGTVVGYTDAPFNDRPTIGQIWTLSGGSYQVLRLDGLVVNLDGWRTSAPQAINDAGQIVGVGYNPDGIQHAYLLTPTDGVPEPGAWALLIAGFGITGAVARRRRAALAA
jgi:uncharacterized membrane protein